VPVPTELPKQDVTRRVHVPVERAWVHAIDFQGGTASSWSIPLKRTRLVKPDDRVKGDSPMGQVAVFAWRVL
jgi:hypothetical protein